MMDVGVVTQWSVNLAAHHLLRRYRRADKVYTPTIGSELRSASSSASMSVNWVRHLCALRPSALQLLASERDTTAPRPLVRVLTARLGPCRY